MTRSTGDDAGLSYEGETSTRVLKFGIALLFDGFETVRSFVRRLAGYPANPPFVVLMYHSVKHDERDRFARQIDQLRRLAHPVYADFAGAATDGRRYVAVTFDDAYHSVLENAFPILNERGVPSTYFVPTQHVGSKPGWITDARHRDAAERLLTDNELRQMRNAGALMGSHGVTHRPLTLLSPSDVTAELAQSRTTLSAMVGQDIDLFALPYGAGNAEVYRMAVAAGYRRVFLNVPVHRGSGGEHVVGRVEVSPTDWPLEYRLKIRGAYQWLPWAMATKRRVMNVLRRFTLKGLRRARPRMGVRAPNSAVN